MYGVVSCIKFQVSNQILSPPVGVPIVNPKTNRPVAYPNSIDAVLNSQGVDD